ncbi:MAG: hypothetical protein ACOCRX_00440 [Candidatus Woesearchaeota archaeon]
MDNSKIYPIGYKKIKTDYIRDKMGYNSLCDISHLENEYRSILDREIKEKVRDFCFNDDELDNYISLLEEEASLCGKSLEELLFD